MSMGYYKAIVICALLATSLLSAQAQLSSENYAQTSTRISDSQMQTVTQYYDGLGRPTEKVEHGVTPGRENLVHLQEYDDLGRIFAQTLLDKEYVAYFYNIRNWKTDIIGQNFSQSLAYNHNNGILIPRKSLYNGNISAMSWQVSDGVKKGFFFDYDSQNMLTGAEYGEGSGLYESNGNYDEYLSYDKMGNVLTLLRYGLRDNGQYGLIDNLSYGYNGNQLLKVDDSANGPYYAGAFHFVDGTNESVEYTYDANGNMVSDKNKGIGSISYDINNQPREICLGDGRKSSYVYDAEGKKHSVSYNLTAMTSAQPLMPEMQSANAESANAANGRKTIHYCDNIIYDDGETIVLNDIGYAKYDKSGNLSFHYYLQDHLGNNRVVMNEDGTIEQVNDYYPTGALMGSSQNGEVQRYKYNGKELDRTHGLDWYDYGARNYDAALVRWNGVDEKSSEYCSIGHYVYCSNNPVRIIDPDGKKMVLVGSYAQRMSFLQVLQKLTNDNLLMNRKTGIVSLSGKPRWSNRGKKLPVGTGLIRDIIANKHTLKIQRSADKNKEDATNKKAGRTKGKGSDAIFSFNKNRGTPIGVAGKNGNAAPGNNVSFSALSHELIHGLRDMEGVSSKDENVIYTFKNWKGDFVESEDSREEVITTGLPIKESYKYTENKIRREHGLPIRVHY